MLLERMHGRLGGEMRDPTVWVGGGKQGIQCSQAHLAVFSWAGPPTLKQVPVPGRVEPVEVRRRVCTRPCEQVVWAVRLSAEVGWQLAFGVGRLLSYRVALHVVER